jgi:hypothetical protein
VAGNIKGGAIFAFASQASATALGSAAYMVVSKRVKKTTVVRMRRFYQVGSF